MINPLVSIVITTKNSERTLGKLLKSIKKQTYPKMEVIVVDNNSVDATIIVTKKFTKKVFNKGPERSMQRNYGVSKSRGEYVLILDSDMVLTKNVVSECVELINKQKDIKEIKIPEKSFGLGIWSEAKKLEREMNEGEGYFESARFFDKKIFWDFNGFDEKMTGPEDWDLPQRIAKKFKVGRINSYIMHDEGRQTLYNLARKKYYYGLSAHKYLKKQKLSVFSPATIYLFRAGFYKRFYMLFSNPIVSIAMIIMLIVETISGGIGYIVGRIRVES